MSPVARLDDPAAVWVWSVAIMGNPMYHTVVGEDDLLFISYRAWPITFCNICEVEQVPIVEGGCKVVQETNSAPIL